MRAIVFDLDHTVYAADGTPREGVVELLTMLRTLGFTVGAVTNDDHHAIVRLDEAGIRPYFVQVLCSDHTPWPKSAPGLVWLAQRLGAELHQTVLISHAHADILLGKEAGVAQTIGVSHGSLNAAPLHEAGADRVVTDMHAVLDVLE